MTHAHLVAELPDGPWVADVSRRHTDASFRVLAAMPDDGPGYALVNVTAPDVGAVLDEMHDHPTLTDISVLARSERDATVQFETSEPMLLRAAKRAGVPIRMPVHIEAGEARLSVIGAPERVPELGDRLEELGIAYRREPVTRVESSGTMLTDRQRETVLAAVENGYYDTPRECSLTELADEIDRAKSTVSETLHRAEEAVVKSLLVDEIVGTSR
ncbi:helix-turn-helix domain-containing protein [Halorubrum sp. DTA98]|uniref:helix-turn-helix domain-containing protein n=1 Tax=Halorubrum sp. DTA98 TaxID=3402163 RepID=UPI003AAAD6E5